jgi:FkbM family methyltransferase
MATDDPIFQSDYIRLKMCRHGPMMFNINDTFIGRQLDVYGEFHEQQGALFREFVKAGDTAVDLGANIGGHTIPLAKHVGPRGRVIAFEPQRVIFTILCGNIALNTLQNVTPVRAAIGAEPGLIQVPTPDPRREANFGAVHLLRDGDGETVSVTTIDQLQLQSCHFMKVDIEGMEIAALHGARATIAHHRPVLYVENDRPDRSAALLAMLLETGYRLWWHMPPLFNPDNFFGKPTNIFGPMVSANVLCVPRERPVALALPEITDPAARPVR